MQTQRTSQQSLLNRAKNGDSEALAKLMAPPLKAKGIQVAVDRKHSLLFISLIGQQCPSKQASLSFLKQGMEKLGLVGIDSVRISGYKAGDYQPLWVERMVLGEDATQCSDNPSESKSGAPKQSLLILSGLLLAFLIIGLLLRALTGPTFLQENSTPSIPQTTEPVEGAV